MVIINKEGIVTTTERQQMWLEEINKQHILYFGGHTGLGKTSQAEYLAEENYRYFFIANAEKENLYQRCAEWLESIKDKNARKLLIIDNVTYLEETNQKVSDIHSLIQHKGECVSLDMIIIGRAQCPAWLRSYRLTGLLQCYGREIFLLGTEEVGSMVRYSLGGVAQTISKTPEEWLMERATEINESQHGFALGIFYCIEILRENVNDRYFLEKKVRSLLWEHIENGMRKCLSDETRASLDKAAIFETFNKEMLQEIFWENEMQLFEKAVTVSSYITPNDRGEYHIDKLFKEFALHRFASLDRAGYVMALKMAGDSCRCRHRYEEALKLYKESGCKENLAELMVEMIEKGDGTDYPRECYTYMDEFSKEDEKKYPCILFVKAMIHSLHVNPEKSNDYIKQLAVLADKEKEQGIYGEARKNYIKTLLCIPHQKVPGFQEMSEQYMELVLNDKNYKGKLQVSGGGPSIINGGIDLMGWPFWKRDVYQYMKNVMGFIIGSDGVAAADVGMGEYYLEKNEQLKAVNYLVSGIEMLKDRENFRTYYVANAVMARCFISENNMSSAKNIMDNMLEQVKQSDFPELENNIRATYVELLLYEGETEKVKKWLEYEWSKGVGSSLKEDFFSSDRYHLYTMAKVYIAVEKYMEAMVIIRQLQVYAEKYNRKYYLVKLHLLNAIVEEANEGSGEAELVKAVMLAGEYGYIRIIADEGIALLRLFKSVDWSKYMEDAPSGFEGYLKKVEKEMKLMAGYYPNYLQHSISGVALSKSEKQVLQFIYFGKTNEKIADELGISLSTVKFHVSNIYKKLEVKNRSQAVKKAIEAGLIS